MKIVNPLIVFDLETTGVWIEKDKVIEIALIKLSPDGKREVFHKKVNPGIPIPAVVTELTGIKDVDVQESPPFKDIANEILEFIGDADFGGFNVARFDLPLLRREMSDAGVKFDWAHKKVFDAQKVYHLNEKRDLTAAYQFYCQKNLEDAHSALADTEATLEILQSQVHKYGEGKEEISVLEAFDYAKRTEFFDDERKFRWWNGKLYMMFGKYARQHCLQDVVKRDRGYLEWILSAKFSEDIKILIEDALKGKFPTPTKEPGSEKQKDLF